MQIQLICHLCKAFEAVKASAKEYCPPLIMYICQYFYYGHQHYVYPYANFYKNSIINISEKQLKNDKVFDHIQPPLKKFVFLLYIPLSCFQRKCCAFGCYGYTWCVLLVFFKIGGKSAQIKNKKFGQEKVQLYSNRKSYSSTGV